MISILIAIAVFRYYQTLAVKYRKSHLKYGFLGMGICLGVQFSFWLIYGMTGLLLNLNEFSQDLEFWAFSIVNILGWIISVIVVWRLRIHLEKKWKKEIQHSREQDIDRLGSKDV